MKFLMPSGNKALHGLLVDVASIMAFYPDQWDGVRAVAGPPCYILDATP